MLTNREKDVLKLICKGYTNPEIAKELFISSSTVKVHVASILRKFEVQNRALAICYAIKHRLIDFEIDDKNKA